MAMIIPGIFIPTSFNKTMVLRNKRGILNRVESSLVCNVSATNFRVIPDFLAVFGYPNVNLTFTKNIRRIFIPEVSASGIFLKQITKQILVFEHIQRQKSAKTIPNETACTVIYMKFFILSVAIGNEFGSMR